MPLRLYNTLTRKLEEFTPRNPAEITFYSCGPTVYDDAHIGNFRSFLAADVLRRWLESPLCELSDGKGGVHRGPRKVVHVMNITDVGHMTDDAEGGEHGEDRMAVAGRRIAEAKKAGKLPADAKVDPSDPYQIARFYEARFKEDAKKLGLKLAIEAEKDPTLMPRATDNVQGMIEIIKRLLERKGADGRPFAYVTGQPGSRVVYFRVKSFAPYGALSGNTLDKLREGQGGRISAENQASKEHPADFLLWKEDPSHIMKWDSPWGKGYPGWHIECTVMSAARLAGRALSASSAADPVLAHGALSRLSLPDGEPLIDLHSGGEDNIFPHHECEIAQSCCAFNAEPEKGTFSKLWFHPRFLLVEGTKMSKSKGNFYTQRDLFEKGIEPAAIRLELIKTHYRSNANFTFQGLTDSQRMVERWRRVAQHRGAAPSTDQSLGRSIAALANFLSPMENDLNVAAAIAAVNEWIAGIDEPSTADIQCLCEFDDVLGVLALDRLERQQTAIGVFLPGVTHSPEVESLLTRRRDARAAKDFKTADAIRDQLASMGYAIKDVPGGKVEVSRK